MIFYSSLGCLFSNLGSSERNDVIIYETIIKVVATLHYEGKLYPFNLSIIGNDIRENVSKYYYCNNVKVKNILIEIGYNCENNTSRTGYSVVDEILCIIQNEVYFEYVNIEGVVKRIDISYYQHLLSSYIFKRMLFIDNKFCDIIFNVLTHEIKMTDYKLKYRESHITDWGYTKIRYDII